MASLGFQFDPTQCEERRGDYQVFPAGRYLLQAMQSDVEDNAGQTGKNAWFEFEIMDGEFKGGTFRHYINNIIHPNDIAQKIGMEELAEFCKAVGQFGVSETEDLHFKPFVANVKLVAAGTVTKGKNGKQDYVQKNDQNRISKYELASGSDLIGGPAAQRANTQTGVQHSQRPVQGQQAAARVQGAPIDTTGARQQQPAQQRPAPQPQGRPAPANAPWNTPRQ